MFRPALAIFRGMIKVKVKIILEQATKAQRERERVEV